MLNSSNDSNPISKVSPSEIPSLSAKPLLNSSPRPAASEIDAAAPQKDAVEITPEGRDLSVNDRIELAKKGREIRQDVRELRQHVREVRREVRHEIFKKIKDNQER